MRHDKTRRHLRGVEPLEDRRVLALGAALVVDLNEGQAGSDPKSGADFDGTLFFSAIDESAERGLWRINTANGAAARFRNVPADRNDLFPSELTSVDGTLFFAAATLESDPLSRLWQSDGTPEGTSRVAADPNGLPRSLTEFNNDLLYYHPAFTGGTELWKVDNTSGAMLLKALPDQPLAFTNVGSTMFFYIDDGTGSPVQIWKTDGSAAGTVLVRSLSDKTISDVAELNGRFFFSASGGGSASLYKSDGTFGGTTPIFTSTAPSARVGEVVNVGGTLYFNVFAGSGADLTVSLWKSTGLAGDAVKVTDLGSPRSLSNVNGELWFVGTDAAHGAEIWTSDGTAAGTTLLKDIQPGPGSGAEAAITFTESAGTIFFRADDGVNGRELWASDGTADGTRMVNINPGSAGSEPVLLANAAGTLYFSAVGAARGRELWKITDQAAPTLGGGGTITYVENAPPLQVVPYSRISDPDSPNFRYGELRLTIAAGGDANDRLGIQNQGTGPGQIGVSGSLVTYGGVPIGTRSGGVTSPLVVLFQAPATPAAVQALVRALTFRTLGDDPSTSPRTLTLQISDGDGGFSNVVSKTINVRAVNDPPRLVLGGQVAYQNNARSILLAAAANVSDVDSDDFAGGLLTVDLTSGRGPTNRLLVGGLYSMQSGELLRDGVVVGTVLEDGIGWHALRIRFNDQMTPARVQELVRSLRFRTVNNTNLDPRIVSFSVTDGDGGVSETRTKTVNLSN